MKKTRTGMTTTPTLPAFSVLGVGQGVVLSFVVTLLGSVLISIVVMLMDWGQRSFGTMQGFNYLAIALGGLFAARRGERFGWLHGALVGALYYVILSVAVSNGPLEFTSTAWLTNLGLSVLVGIVGGVLGVNF